MLLMLILTFDSQSDNIQASMDVGQVLRGFELIPRSSALNPKNGDSLDVFLKYPYGSIG